MSKTVVCFGEIMLRLATPGRLRLAQALPGSLAASFGGGEANVGVSLACLGMPVRYVTALPRNAVAEALLETLRGYGLDTQHVARAEKGRLGIYFLEPGALQRASVVVYDRAATCISLLGPNDYAFEPALEGAAWVHVTGITPSLSRNAYLATLRLVELAVQRKIPVSCDMNFRKKLWTWNPPKTPRELAAECLPPILSRCSLIIGNEEDAADVLDIRAANTSVEDGRLNAEAYTHVAQRIAERFPQCNYVAITLRESLSADYNRWGGLLFNCDESYAHFAPLAPNGAYQPYELRDIVDRVGGGDAFAAGLIHALHSDAYCDPQTAIRFAVAASSLKHSIEGDFNLATEAEIAALMEGSGSGRVQR